MQPTHAAKRFTSSHVHCAYCRHKRFHTYATHQRELELREERMLQARRRRAPRDEDWDGRCMHCLRGNAHTNGEHDCQVQIFIDYDGTPERYEPHDGYPY